MSSRARFIVLVGERSCVSSISSYLRLEGLVHRSQAAAWQHRNCARSCIWAIQNLLKALTGRNPITGQTQAQECPWLACAQYCLQSACSDLPSRMRTDPHGARRSMYKKPGAGCSEISCLTGLHFKPFASQGKGRQRCEAVDQPCWS